MNKQQDFLVQACNALGLGIALDHEVFLTTAGRSVVAQAYIAELGPLRGMLVFSSSAQIGGGEKDLIDSGYGYSVYAEPSPGEQFDLDSYVEMFNDWAGKPIAR